MPWQAGLHSPPVLPLLAAFAASTLMTLWLVHQCRRRPGRGLDDDFALPQKIHALPAPRIGGIGIVVGLIAGVTVSHFSAGPAWSLSAMVLLLCAMPAFLAGLVHDFTDSLTPRGRLVATAVSAALAFALLDAQIRSADIPGLDWVLATGVGSLLGTLLAVAGIAHAVNIIDGLNGLASMCVVIMLAGVAYVAGAVGDTLVLGLALAGIGAVLGFFVWNFPGGFIFLGDGGAYFLGFYLAETTILLLVRNPEVSPLFGLLVCVYPIVETLFSAWRRYWLRAQPASLPDGIHLHTLVYRRLMRWAVGAQDARAVIRANSLSAPYLWVLCSASVAPAALFWDQPMVLGGLMTLFALSYLLLYRRIVRFRSPRFMRRRGSTRPAPLAPRLPEVDGGDNSG